MAFILVKTSDYVSVNQIGLLHLFTMPLWAFMLIGILLMDLIGAWFIHFLEHKVQWMWRFHLVHHTDQQIDTTSANRHHPGESVFRFVFTTLAVIPVSYTHLDVYKRQERNTSRNEQGTRRILNKIRTSNKVVCYR